MYEYRSAAHPVCQNTRKLAQTGRVHIHAHDSEGQMTSEGGQHRSVTEHFYDLRK